MMELRPGWQGELESWQVSLAVLPPRSRLAATLRLAGWQTWYSDETAVVLRRESP